MLEFWTITSVTARLWQLRVHGALAVPDAQVNAAGRCGQPAPLPLSTRYTAPWIGGGVVTGQERDHLGDVGGRP